ncbi:MAG TPA: 50S ribosomal protein L25 [Acidimicrobiales bacterium]|nr:50S ribosomal protein L25 [Acidimicrobiales bacterium]
MEEVSLLAEAGRTTGSAASRRLRHAGKVPAVLYGHGVDPQSLAVDSRELRGALQSDAGLNALISLTVDGTNHLAMARQLQRHPVRRTIDHVDFVIVRRDEVVAVEVPVHLVGEALEVHRNDGLVEQQLFSLVIHATPSNIPSTIDVDVSELTIGDAVRVGDLKLPSGVTTDVDPEEPIVAGQASRVAADLEAEAAEEAAEAEAAAPEGAPEPDAGDRPTGDGGGSSQEG